MKELNFEQMENIEGGRAAASDYCDTLGKWIDNGGEGYQGNYQDVINLWGRYC
ncbi:MAG: hypothetical protein JEZ01_07960 [Labilibaculum sp.]|nr:hypothetical protein [Labilibaculum sp.]MBI9057696.1 hypothetical protein [Labilibaculum sp.]